MELLTNLELMIWLVPAFIVAICGLIFAFVDFKPFIICLILSWGFMVMFSIEVIEQGNDRIECKLDALLANDSAEACA